MDLQRHHFFILVKQGVKWLIFSWKYTPDYFQAPWAFHVGRNSNNILRTPLR